MTHSNPPRIENAPGIVWRKRSHDRWEARWRPRTDLVERGCPMKTTSLWIGADEPSDVEAAWISDNCNRLQSEMLVWGRGGIPTVSAYDGTLRSLIACYQTDPDSKYRKLRYRSRLGYNTLMDRIERDHGDQTIGDRFDARGNKIDGIKVRTLNRWYEAWSANGHITMAHSLMSMLRTLTSFGLTYLEDDECARVRAILRDMRITMAKPREARLTADQVIAIRAKAHNMKRPSVALAQAFQFECTLRQKDVIGEWIPLNEPPLSDVHSGNDKWLRGLLWSEIDANLILRHTTSKRNKDIEVNLRFAPMVMEELKLAAGLNLADSLTRANLPASGPIIVSEATRVPYSGTAWRRMWRRVATAAGVPKAVFNMDSRAGAISEATDAGAALEDVRHAATHGDISMTQRYSRGAAEKTAKVMQIRSESRNKK